MNRVCLKRSSSSRYVGGGTRNVQSTTIETGDFKNVVLHAPASGRQSRSGSRNLWLTFGACPDQATCCVSLAAHREVNGSSHGTSPFLTSISHLLSVDKHQGTCAIMCFIYSRCFLPSWDLSEDHWLFDPSVNVSTRAMSLGALWRSPVRCRTSSLEDGAVRFDHPASV